MTLYGVAQPFPLLMLKTSRQGQAAAIGVRYSSEKSKLIIKRWSSRRFEEAKQRSDSLDIDGDGCGWGILAFLRWVRNQAKSLHGFMSLSI